MGSMIHFALKIFLLHLVLYAGNGNGDEATREKIGEENGNVLRLPSMDKHTNHHMMHHHHLDPAWRIFFTLNDLKIGRKMPIYFPTKNSPPLLSRNEANSIPFSYNHLPYLLNFFSFSADSPQAKAMENTLRECQIKPIKGETKVCATCLESTHDFVHETFGLETRFEVLQTTHIGKSGRSSIDLDNYTILSDPEEMRVPSMVACHTLPYPYRVFYCHSQKSENKLFKVSLGGDNGGRVEAVAVCHMDTSQWSRDHASFRVLGTEPGASPVCHFFRADVLVYVPIYLD